MFLRNSPRSRFLGVGEVLEIDGRVLNRAQMVNESNLIHQGATELLEKSNQ